jgi:hypothetical protein
MLKSRSAVVTPLHNDELALARQHVCQMPHKIFERTNTCVLLLEKKKKKKCSP